MRRDSLARCSVSRFRLPSEQEGTWNRHLATNTAAFDSQRGNAVTERDRRCHLGEAIRARKSRL